MAIADLAHSNDDGRELTKARPRLGVLSSLRPKLATIAVMACAIGLAGCARSPAQREFNPVLHTVKSGPVCPPARPRMTAKSISR